jgi:hypothetical protein
MAGIFGNTINSRADFQKELARAKADCDLLLQRLPHEDTLASVARQLEALHQWIANGRIPTADERRSISMGIQLHREYETTDDVDIYRLRRLAGALDNYVKSWPDDKTAADPNNANYL